MTVERFYSLLLEEIKDHPKLREYYRFLNYRFLSSFRKTYFCQRLQYILDQVKGYSQKLNGNLPVIWDCGCGYATTQIYLALNGFPSTGSTLEFYYQELPKRFHYWSQYGNMELVQVHYEDIFEKQIADNSLDIIIVQDTLHHLEPLQESLQLFKRALKPGGMLIAIEENGNNLIQNAKLFLKRGNKRIIHYWDEKLQKSITMGNENIRPWKKWKEAFEKVGLQPDAESLHYIRFFLPFVYPFLKEEKVVELEQKVARSSPFLREYFFFGINFVVRKPS